MGLAVRWRVPAVIAVALVSVAPLLPARAAIGSQPPPAPAPVTASQLTALETAADAATAQANRLLAQLETAAAHTVGIRIAIDQVESARVQLQAELDDQVRAVYEQGMPSQFASVLIGELPDDLQVVIDAQQHTAHVDRSLVTQLQHMSTQLQALQQRAENARRALLGPAMAAEQAAGQALQLLADAQSRYQLQQQQAAELAARRAELEALSAQVTSATAVSVGPSGRAAQAAQAPIIAALEAAGPNIPPGYQPTSQVITGIGSWYGPGFVGHPTSSGSPYDPERLTCAMLLVPLGTVVHVEANGRAVNCLVNDHGPYVGGRVIDMSRAGSRALGYDGLAQVRITVLARTQ